MALIIHIDYGNGSFKTLANVDPGLNMSVTGALDAAQMMQPGLEFDFDKDFIDRGGREVGAVTSIDGVDAGEDRVWGIWVNERAVSDLRRVVPESVSHIGMARVENGDVTTCRLMQQEA